MILNRRMTDSMIMLLVVLGVWQALYFAEFDGPRQRQVWVKIT